MSDRGIFGDGEGDGDLDRDLALDWADDPADAVVADSTSDPLRRISAPSQEPDWGDISVLDGPPPSWQVPERPAAAVDDPLWAAAARADARLPGVETEPANDSFDIDGLGALAPSPLGSPSGYDFDEPFDVDDFVLDAPEGLDAFDLDEARPVELWEPAPPPPPAPASPVVVIGAGTDSGWSADPPPTDEPTPPPRRHLVISDLDEDIDEISDAGRSVPAPILPTVVPPAATPSPTAGSAGKVVIDAIDDLPDAIQLGTAERDGGSGLRFGDDDDLEIVLPGDKPKAKMDERVRKRRTSVRRSAGRRRLKVLLAVALPVLAIVGALAVLSSSMFALNDVRVDGQVYTTDEELAAILQPVIGEPVLTIDTQQLERELARLPWVARASADTRFPHRLDVTIVERAPAATFMGADGLWRVLDVEGAVIAVLPDGGRPADLLAIVGTGPDLAAGANAGSSYQTLAQLATTLDRLPILRPSVEAIAVNGPDIALNLTTGAVVNLGSASKMREKLAVVLTVLQDPERNLDEITSINVSDPTKPAIQ